MAKYCIHCGKKLKESEVCNCQAAQEKKLEGFGGDLLDVLRGMFFKPVDTLKTYSSEKYFNLSLILVGILAFISSLLVCSVVSNFADMYFGYGVSLYSAFGYSIPYLRIFFIALVIFAANAFVYAGLLYLVNYYIFKGENDFKKVFAFYGVNSVILAVASLVSAIFLFVNFFLGVFVLVIGGLLNAIYTYKGIENLGVQDTNKHGYIYLLTTVFYAIVWFIILLVFG